ncbi:hypothetical protein PILCRDRAFT_810920 [Piloderma croceum F 1598]|uniref:C2H2-type domain-containing protein n=1 Tax=Piloderma croceum (strain F 1598) TaxID=765440 RepID=A0A0C3GJ31_PILCF|nr:hypothetical protein PILCRDRAFT_810920 [Piloderma croceum F 1598]
MPTMDAYYHTHQPGNLTVPPFNQSGTSSHQHPPPRDMSSMLSEFSISSHPTPTSASAASPYFDKTLVRPSMSTMQMKSNSLEAIDDPESLSTFNSFIEPSDLYHSTTDNIPDDVPSRSSSSQSSTSRSTSESDTFSQISSIPIGRTTGRHSSSASTSSAGGAPRKNKMHQCPMCPKSFPRPSGLETHMNSHTGARPYKCPLPGCDKAFAVRSNAKRHYKTHGFPPSAAESNEPQSTFTVGFNAPHITYNYEPRGDFPELKWVQPGQTTRMSRDEPDSPSGSDEADSGPGPSSPPYPQPGSFGSRSRYDAHPYHSK